MATLANLIVRITGDTSSFVRATQTANNALGTMGANLQKRGAMMTTVGRSMTRNLTLPVLAAAGASVKLAVDFDDALTKIGALVGGIGIPMKKVRSELLGMAKDVGKSPQELAEGLYYVTSSGFKGAEAMNILRASAKAAASGLGEVQTVADAVTSAVNAYGAKNLEASRATDILLATVREGKAEPEELAGVIGRVIPVAEAMGVSFDEVGAGIAGMSLSGLDAAESVTALRGIMTSVIKPSKDATKAFKEIGLPIDEFRQSVEDKGLFESLKELRDRIGDNKTMMGRLFPNVRALAGFLNLTGRNADKNAKIFKELAVAVGDTDRAMEKTRKSEGFRFKQLMAELQAVAVDIGHDLLPVLVDIAHEVKGVIRDFQKLPDSLQKGIVKWALYAAALGPVLSIFGRLTKWTGWLIVNLSKLGRVAAATTAATTAATLASQTAMTGGAAAGTASPWLKHGAFGSKAVGAASATAAPAAAAAPAAVPYGLIAATAAAGAFVAWKLDDHMKDIQVASGAAESEMASFARRMTVTSTGPMGGMVSGVKDFKQSMDEGNSVINSALDAMNPFNDSLKENSIYTVKNKNAISAMNRILGVNQDLTKKQIRSLGQTLDVLPDLGGKWDKLTLSQANNLLKVGDFKGAMKILQGALDGASKKLVNNKADFDRSGEAAADAGQKVRGLGTSVRNLPNSKTITFTMIGLDGILAGLSRVRSAIADVGNAVVRTPAPRIVPGGTGETTSAPGQTGTRTVGGTAVAEKHVHFHGLSSEQFVRESMRELTWEEKREQW